MKRVAVFQMATKFLTKNVFLLVQHKTGVCADKEWCIIFIEKRRAGFEEIFKGPRLLSYFIGNHNLYSNFFRHW
jgi:hypothetical protein